jgi:hypothetical protein
MQSKAATVEEYLASLPEGRRAAVEAVRAVILANLDAGYSEGMQYGMIGYAVPHSLYPKGYHVDPRQPLGFAALASQKQHLSLYMMSLYGGPASDPHLAWFVSAWKKTGKKLDMGKACIRFKRVEDVPLEVIGEAIRRMPAKLYIARCEKALAAYQESKAARPRAGRAKPAKRPAKKAPPKKKQRAARLNRTSIAPQ